MLNQPVTHSVVTPTATVLPSPAANPFAEITGHAGLIASEFSYKKDEEIYGEDEPAEYVYQVISGAVRSYKLLSDGRRQIGAFHLPGDVFGLEFGSSHRLAAEAIIDTNVRLVKRRSLEQAASVDVAVARKLWTMTAGDLRHAEDHMLLLGRKTAMERVATFLLEMDRRLAVAGMMALPMCRRDIGDYLGLTLETVSRALSQLHSQGVLGFSGARQIVLRNRQRLRSMDA
ncbi:MAG: helix-turn-helix domain-containing protein [Bradyrhizobium sp.]|uniref:Helix-turn-helix domain-containing protein n=2 Tax=Bradyrhizobium TaxID=374 RepID=A0ABS5G6Y7_9BRAD|nr:MULTISPECIES: helix-turn-helix domain-containing protein [Bradyrhizobium]RTM03340.1 MAG: cyclic nucleotide-binding domain-containing protein [Bradyrhizobiaceae bacterium]ABQ34919.1 transcriptional regulator, Crp/Fnr family [Bradyrhizobium sp. BTAi1]MBR1136916.1 helix-turn-helix domain-containing protein [Bradyrhizobium denitrificans]MCL8485019.1 helix-turn-helix domain-containing protein [Bradyrhizobium denitrificans]MDU1492521.1 helix-turn-helix domain-containing protein [Bradyrhizobium sp